MIAQLKDTAEQRQKYLGPKGFPWLRVMAVLLAISSVGFYVFFRQDSFFLLENLLFTGCAALLFFVAPKCRATWRAVQAAKTRELSLKKPVTRLLTLLALEGLPWVLLLSFLVNVDSLEQSVQEFVHFSLWVVLGLACYYFTFVAALLYLATGEGKRRVFEAAAILFALWLALMVFTVMGPAVSGSVTLAIGFGLKVKAEKRL